MKLGKKGMPLFFQMFNQSERLRLTLTLFVHIFLSSFLESCATRGIGTHRAVKRKPPSKSTSKPPSKPSRDKQEVEQDIWKQNINNNKIVTAAGEVSTSTATTTKTSTNDVSLRRSVTVAFDDVVRRRLSNVVTKSISLNFRRVPVTLKCDDVTTATTTTATSARNER